MDKVYVITDGQYSDYHIVAVFSSKEEAINFKNSVDNENNYGFNEIEEYELNYERIPKDYKFYHLKMSREGEVIVINKEYRSWFKRKEISIYDKLINIINLLAKDEEHAIKIANEIRVQLIARNEI